jgi:allophycocyanin alpha subunit
MGHLASIALLHRSIVLASKQRVRRFPLRDCWPFRFSEYQLLIQYLVPFFGGIHPMSIVTKSIVNADAEARYLSPGELDRIKGFVTSGEKRLRIAQVLTESRERIVKQAGDQLFQKRPDVVSPGGNAYGEEMTATCLRDMDYYLRLITYGVVAGDVTPIEEIGLVGVREMYNSLGTPIPAVAEAVRCMKAVASGLLSSEDAAEASAYFDYVVGAMQ